MGSRRKNTFLPSLRSLFTVCILFALIITPVTSSTVIESGAYSSFNAERPNGLDIVENNADGIVAVSTSKNVTKGNTETLVTVTNNLNFAQDITITLDGTTSWTLGNGLSSQTKTASSGGTVSFDVSVGSSATTGTHNYTLTTTATESPSQYTFEQTQDVDVNSGGFSGAVVASDGSKDYETISAAVAGTTAGTDIRVLNTGNGYYNETVTINSDRNITAEDGVCMAGGGTGNAFTIPDNSTASPVLDGFCIKNYQHAYEFNYTEGEWKIVNTELYSHEQHGVLAFRSVGDFTLKNVYVNGSTESNIDVTETSSSFTMTDIVTKNSRQEDGIDGRFMSSSFVMRNVSSVENGDRGVDIRGSGENFTVENSTFNKNTGPGLDADQIGRGEVGLIDGSNNKTANFTNIVAENNGGAGVRFPGTATNVFVTNSEFRRNNQQGLGAFSADGNVTIRDVVSVNNNLGMNVEGSDTIKVYDSEFNNNDARGVNADTGESDTVMYFENITVHQNGGIGFDGGNQNTAENITITESTITENGAAGVYFFDSQGFFRITYTNISNNDAFGINNDQGNSAFDIDYVKITQNGDFGVKGYETGVQWSIQNSILVNNTDNDLTDNNGVFYGGNNPTDIATRNWWGQASGPKSSQLLGASNMNTSNPLASKPGDAGDPTPT